MHISIDWSCFSLETSKREFKDSLELLVMGEQNQQGMTQLKLPAFGSPRMYGFSIGQIDTLENGQNPSNRTPGKRSSYQTKRPLFQKPWGRLEWTEVPETEIRVQPVSTLPVAQWGVHLCPNRKPEFGFLDSKLKEDSKPCYVIKKKKKKHLLLVSSLLNSSPSPTLEDPVQQSK